MSLHIVSIGIGNIQSLANALHHLGVTATVTSDPAELRHADKVLLPGVGAFNAAMTRLHATGFRDALDEHVRGRGRPLMGICLGMQLLAEEGTEFGTTAGLGYIPGRVELIPPGDPPVRLPHIGWNTLQPVGSGPLLRGVEGDRDCYFVHSYHFVPRDPADVAATVRYGAGPVTAAVARAPVFGVQFHPEKSQKVGLAILSNFLAV